MLWFRGDYSIWGLSVETWRDLWIHLVTSTSLWLMGIFLILKDLWGQQFCIALDRNLHSGRVMKHVWQFRNIKMDVIKCPSIKYFSKSVRDRVEKKSSHTRLNSVQTYLVSQMCSLAPLSFPSTLLILWVWPNPDHWLFLYLTTFAIKLEYHFTLSLVPLLLYSLEPWNSIHI